MTRTAARAPSSTSTARRRGTLRNLVGSGHKIALFTLPFIVAAVIVDLVDPGFFGIGTPPAALRIASVVILVVGVLTWAWSVALILVKVPRRELITTGPYAVVKHPLYTCVALLVLPWVGFPFGTWLWRSSGSRCTSARGSSPVRRRPSWPSASANAGRATAATW